MLHGLTSTCSSADQVPATMLMAANAARCTVNVCNVVVRVIWYRRARPTTNGVASAHGSQQNSSVAKSGSQTRWGCSFCRTSTDRLASTSEPAHQIAAIQSKRVERAPVFVMILVVHHH